ncbi:sialic acid-binding Ig-like lectin 5 [Neosynchiropus ocellatus]
MKSVLMTILTSALVQARLKETCPHRGFCVTLDDEIITAERGLCVTVPCSFKTPQNFTPQHMHWYRCWPRKRQWVCDHSSDPIYSSDRSSAIRKGFEGRVSLLESDVSQGNCSIIINDLSRSDSGWYHLRVTNEKKAVTYGKKQGIYVGGLSQKPILDVPQLKEGQLTALTCTAPGLCSGSEPTISWRWEGKGKTQQLTGGNITAQKSACLGAVRRQYSSALMFSASSEHHSSSITCTVVFKRGWTTEAKKTLEVQYLKSVTITGQTLVREGETLSLNCTAESFPPVLVRWTKGRTSEALANNTGKAALMITAVTKEHSGPYRCTAEQGSKRVMQEVEVKVKWFAGILNGSRCEWDSAALTCVCGSQGHPLPSISWPLLTDHSDSQTNVSGDEIWSSFSVKDGQSVTSVLCVVSYERGNTKMELPVPTFASHHDSQSKFLTIETLVAFLVGVFLSGIIFLVVQLICCRNRQKSPKHTEIPLTNGADQQTPKAETAVGEREPQEPDPGRKDVHYSAINFSHLRGKSPRKASETMETEYSEINRPGVTAAAEEPEKRSEEQEDQNEVLERQEADQEMALYSNISTTSLGTTK